MGRFDGLITLNPRSENIEGFSGDLLEIAITLSARAVFEADFDLDGDVEGADLDLCKQATVVACCMPMAMPTTTWTPMVGTFSSGSSSSLVI